MKTFEQIQTEKAERAEKLLELLPKIAGMPKNEEQMKALAENLTFLAAKAKEQKKMCNDQRATLLDEELAAILKIGAEPDIAPIRSALILIASRKTSLNMLK
ncbi:MAG: hypothetical protein NTW67_01300 [Candidatus Woesearchaeota archaeon]|nr:hypothetical protein [Candidatus Woesearchaeota archaeon]